MLRVELTTAVPLVSVRAWLAHGIGGRADLPLPGELVLQTGGFVVLVSFLAVGVLWHRPRFSGDDEHRPGWPLPAVVQRAADSARLRAVLRGLTGILLGYLVAVAFVGPADPDYNPAPRALYVLAWVGIVPASLLFGPVWRLINPLRAIYRRNPRPVPQWVGYWPAAVGLTVFVWLELVPADRAEPPVVGAFLLGYAVVVTAGALVYGEPWFARADPFEVYSTLVAALAPVGRRPDGLLAWRNPLRGLATVPPAAGLVAVLAVWWGSTVFDGVSGTTWWANTPHLGPVGATAALLALFGLVAASYRLATGPLAAALVSTLVPIAVGYTIAHYASLLLTEGPRGLAQLIGADPPVIAVHPGLIAAIQVTAILVGHVVGVVAAHDRALVFGGAAGEHPASAAASAAGSTAAVRGNSAAASTTTSRRLADQVPLVLVMVVYTMIGLYLLVIA